MQAKAHRHLIKKLWISPGIRQSKPQEPVVFTRGLQGVLRWDNPQKSVEPHFPYTCELRNGNACESA